MIKAIILDIDGTLTNSKKEITTETRNALLRAQKSGIRLALASARSDHGLERFGRQLDLEQNNGIYICYNGGLILNAGSGEVYYEKAIPAELAKEILEHLKRFDCIPMINRGEYMYLNDVYRTITVAGKVMDVIRYETRSNEFLICEKPDLAAFVDFPLLKILVAASDEYLRDHMEEMGRPFSDRVKTGPSTSFYYEFNTKGVDKASAVKKAFTSLGIHPDEMMAFGDGENDLSMLSYVKYGIAMGNAVQKLKDAAFDITDDNDHDGIAKAIYKYIPEL